MIEVVKAPAGPSCRGLFSMRGAAAFALRVVIVGLAMALTTTSGMPQGMLGKRAGRSAPPVESPKIKADEKAYKAAIDKIPDKKSSDPWGTVRSSGQAKSQSQKN